MAGSGSTVEVVIHNRVLWVGGNSYALHNVTGTRRTVTTPDRSAAIRKFGRTLLYLFLVFILGGLLLEEVVESRIASNLFGWIIVFAFFALVGLVIKRLFSLDRHNLVIDTPNGSKTVITSTDGGKVDELNRRITQAIGDSSVAMRIQIENAHIGDSIIQYGSHNTGKQGG
ncbi:DUF6232 family protein [Streptomyces sp. NPDC047974]|uniref:DUF6232 family protein n=1 Tax=Streptomyces sp. NPDC047974 TaxID=3154343 RepID=UPI0033ED326F